MARVSSSSGLVTASLATTNLTRPTPQSIPQEPVPHHYDAVTSIDQQHIGQEEVILTPNIKDNS